MGKNVIQSKAGITITFGVSVKTVTLVKKIVFGILLYAVVKIASPMDDSTIKCDEIIDSYSEQNKNYSDKF